MGKFTIHIIMLTFGIILIPELALASGGASGGSFSNLVNIICYVASVLQSQVGVAVASIAIVLMAAQAFRGKLDWTVFLVTALGLMILFNAELIVQELTGEASPCANYSGGMPAFEFGNFGGTGT